MSTLFWWVLASVIVSFFGIPIGIIGSILYARMKFQDGSNAADARLSRMIGEINAIGNAIEDARSDAKLELEEKEEESFDRDQFIEANGPLLDAVADHIFARWNLKDQNSANALAPKSNEAKRLIGLIGEMRTDPEAAFKLAGLDRNNM